VPATQKLLVLQELQIFLIFTDEHVVFQNRRKIMNYNRLLSTFYALFFILPGLESSVLRAQETETFIECPFQNPNSDPFFYKSVLFCSNDGTNINGAKIGNNTSGANLFKYYWCQGAMYPLEQNDANYNKSDVEGIIFPWVGSLNGVDGLHCFYTKRVTNLHNQSDLDIRLKRAYKGALTKCKATDASHYSINGSIGNNVVAGFKCSDIQIKQIKE